MSNTAIANFYKSATHDYESFFNNYEISVKEKEINARIKKLSDELEEARVEMTKVQNNRYNSDFTPLGKKIIVLYNSNRSDFLGYFDLSTGASINRDSLLPNTFIIKEVNLKGGDFWVIVGYCFSLGAIVSRHYRYRIATNNSSCNFVMEGEQLIPILEPNAKPVSDGNAPAYEAGMGDSAVSFISQVWDIPVENIGVNYTFKELKFALNRNKSTEIIFRTAPKSIQNALLNLEIETAEPVYKLVHLTKAEYKEANDRNILDDWMNLQSIVDSAFKKDKNTLYYGHNGEKTLEDFCHYTNQEWFDIIEKAKYWDEEFEFNHVQIGVYGGKVFFCTLSAYLRNYTSYRNSKFYQFYTFGKFMDYVCEETVNQGFKSLNSFMGELRDYLDMCVSMDIKPTLYSSYLKQTHDITSRNYEVKLTEEQAEMFEKAYKDFKPFVTENKAYSIVRPKNADDIKHEGSALNHCVASYISKILKRNCLIVFLRKTKATDKPLVTIEVENEAIVQARGASNRSITEDEYQAICEYAKKNKLKVRVTPRD